MCTYKIHVHTKYMYIQNVCTYKIQELRGGRYRTCIGQSQ